MRPTIAFHFFSDECKCSFTFAALGNTSRISNTLEVGFCVDALNEAIHKFGPPEIMNTDQGSQFTSFAWTDRLPHSNVRISMEGKGRFLDNIFVERLWRSLKYECVYLHACETGSEARAGVRKWIELYNYKRTHSSLGGKPPAVAYWLRIETTPISRFKEKLNLRQILSN
jgi:putative transposase